MATTLHPSSFKAGLAELRTEIARLRAFECHRTRVEPVADVASMGRRHRKAHRS